MKIQPVNYNLDCNSENPCLEITYEIRDRHIEDNYVLKADKICPGNSGWAVRHLAKNFAIITFYITEA